MNHKTENLKHVGLDLKGCFSISLTFVPPQVYEKITPAQFNYLSKLNRWRKFYFLKRRTIRLTSSNELKQTNFWKDYQHDIKFCFERKTARDEKTSAQIEESVADLRCTLRGRGRGGSCAQKCLYKKRGSGPRVNETKKTRKHGQAWKCWSIPSSELKYARKRSWTLCYITDYVM